VYQQSIPLFIRRFQADYLVYPNGGLARIRWKGDEEQFLNWYTRNKVVSITINGKKPPKCTHLPFTPIRFDYVSPDELAEVNELFYSDSDVD